MARKNEDNVKSQDSAATFSKRLGKIMEERKLTAKDVEAISGVPDRSINNYVNGAKAPFPRGMAIAKALGVDPYWLAGIEKPPIHSGSEADLEGLKAQAGAGSIKPSEVPPTDSAKMLVGHFRFGSRKIRTHIVFDADGPPSDFGGYVPPE